MAKGPICTSTGSNAGNGMTNKGIANPNLAWGCYISLREQIRNAPEAEPMTQTSNRIFDEMARLMNDAAGVAQGVRREFDTLFRAQAERILRDLDVVQREEFEAVKEMARLAREENEALKSRIAALEGRLSAKKGASPAAAD